MTPNEGPLTPMQRQILWVLAFSLTVSGLFVFFAVWSGTKDRMNAAPPPRVMAPASP